MEKILLGNSEGYTGTFSIWSDVENSLNNSHSPDADNSRSALAPEHPLLAQQPVSPHLNSPNTRPRTLVPAAEPRRRLPLCPDAP